MADYLIHYGVKGMKWRKHLYKTRRDDLYGHKVAKKGQKKTIGDKIADALGDKSADAYDKYIESVNKTPIVPKRPIAENESLHDWADQAYEDLDSSSRKHDQKKIDSIVKSYKSTPIYKIRQAEKKINDAASWIKNKIKGFKK